MAAILDRFMATAFTRSATNPKTPSLNTSTTNQAELALKSIEQPAPTARPLTERTVKQSSSNFLDTILGAIFSFFAMLGKTLCSPSASRYVATFR